MNPQQIADATGSTFERAMRWVAPLSDAMHEFAINTPVRKAAFMAQIGHESQGLIYSKELWGPTLAQRRYQGRADLGNLQPGDGKRYMGRGFIQVTGRYNYAAAGVALQMDLIGHPEILEQHDMPALASAWWWWAHGCNELADAGDFDALTRRINGGLNGIEDRKARWAKAKAAFGVGDATCVTTT